MKQIKCEDCGLQMSVFDGSRRRFCAGCRIHHNKPTNPKHIKGRDIGMSAALSERYLDLVCQDECLPKWQRRML